MRTRLMIMAIVLAATAGAVGVVVLLVTMFGWLGLAIGAPATIVVLAAYRLWIQPWQHRWGATDEEVHRTMPGDDLLPDAASTTRAITIAARPEQVWPWLVQLGYGRAGWYSYDWIDNDGQASADRVIPELQQLQVGDQILMLPGMGPRVRELQPNRHFVAGDQEAGIWCLALYPTEGGCRLVSRWRVDWPLTPATALWILLSDPGAFIMEHKMLKGIRFRAEATVRAGERRLLPSGGAEPHLYRPPLMAEISPVLEPDSGSARNVSTRATSPSSPRRPMGGRAGGPNGPDRAGPSPGPRRRAAT